MVTFEGTLAAKSYQREPEYPVYQSLVKVTMWMMIVYLIVKIVDLSSRGALSLAFNGSLESNMFLLEMVVGIVIPIIMYAIPSIRTTRWGVLTASILVVAGVILSRVNVNFTGMAKAAGGSYFPSIWEWLITLGLWSVLILAYCFIVENFAILPREEHARQKEAA
jgi:Polysulphide reductase